MIKKIGILGASTIYGLGSPDDVELFFLQYQKLLSRGSGG
jgi:hypothetical protein